MRVVSLKINSNVLPTKNTNSHYLLLNTTKIPLSNGKISLIFFVMVALMYIHQFWLMQYILSTSIQFKKQQDQGDINPLVFSII